MQVRVQPSKNKRSQVAAHKERVRMPVLKKFMPKPMQVSSMCFTNLDNSCQSFRCSSNTLHNSLLEDKNPEIINEMDRESSWLLIWRGSRSDWQDDRGALRQGEQFFSECGNSTQCSSRYLNSYCFLVRQWKWEIQHNLYEYYFSIDFKFLPSSCANFGGMQI